MAAELLASLDEPEDEGVEAACPGRRVIRNGLG